MSKTLSEAARVCTPEETAETERYLAETLAQERARTEETVGPAADGRAGAAHAG